MELSKYRRPKPWKELIYSTLGGIFYETHFNAKREKKNLFTSALIFICCSDIQF